MNSLTRLVGYSVLLLLVFLGAALAAQGWLHGQTQQLRTEAIESRRAQFAVITRILTPATGTWSDKDDAPLGAMIGGVVSINHETLPAPPKDAAVFYFDQVLPGHASAPSTFARVTFPAPPIGRLIALHQRVDVGLALLAVTLLGLWFVLIAFAWRRPALETASRSPWAAARVEMSGLTQLARTSVAQGEELDRERDVRRRAEEDAQLRQRLLAQSLEGKIRLGHDLHDGIIQSLYAVGLTLESVRALVPTDPTEADRRLEKCLQSLNGTIRDVRAYITGLGPENLRRIGFAQALDALVAELKADRDVKFELRIDDEATARLSAEQSIDALQIAREAISNALRHGRATVITVRLQHGNEEIGLLVQDNGAGFDSSLSASGHGLVNMHARAERLGAKVRVDSRPGAGTRIVITLPVLQNS